MNEHDATEIAYKKGYNDAAREIFKEIETLKKQWVSGDINDNEFCKHIYQIEKKYTE